MVSRPSLLVLDEPTSGLDSNKAAKVIKILSKLAKENCAIVYTIHQPSFLLYSMMDRLLLLHQGKVVYQGLSSEIQNYLIDLNINIPINNSICDFFMMETSDFKKVKDNYETSFNNETYQSKQLKIIES